MASQRWDPFRELISLQERMHRLFEDTLTRSRRGEEILLPSSWSPAVDIYETPHHVILKAELPGLNKEDIFIEIKDNTLILRGERKVEKGIDEENYHQMERSFGPFHRSFAMPTKVKPDKIKAKLSNGILEIIVPKLEKVKPKKITVEAD